MIKIILTRHDQGWMLPVGNMGLCTSGLGCLWNLPKNDGAKIELQIRKTPAPGTTKVVLDSTGDVTLYSTDATHLTEHYLVVCMRVYLKMSGVKINTEYHVRFMV